MPSNGPACAVSIARGHVAVDGISTDIVADIDPDHPDDTHAVAYARDSGSVYVAWTGHGRHGAPYGSPTLYSVVCKASRSNVVARVDDADFGHALLSSDGKQLFATGKPGVIAIELPSGRDRIITVAPMAPCRDDHDVQRPTDWVKALHDDQLEIARGGNCGFEGDWDAVTWLLDHPGTAKQVLHQARPISVVAVEAGGAVWAGASPCESDGKLWRSTDRGDHWTEATLPGNVRIGALWADTARPGHLVVRTATCAPPGDIGGELETTRDGGRTWQAEPLPDSVMSNAMASSFVVALRGGSIDHLTIWGGDSPRVAVSSDDGGASWNEVTPVPAEPKPVTEVKSGDVVYQASSDGLLRSIGGARAERLYPHDGPGH
jgi:hypothetical protein